MQYGFRYRTSAYSYYGAPTIITAPFTSIQADGWQAVYATTPPTFNPNVSPVAVSVNRQGFNNTGDPITFSENFIITQRVRQPYPNHGLLTSLNVSLSDYVLSTDTIVGVTNNSTEISPKPIVNWTMLSRTVVDNELILEATGNHWSARNGKPFACMKYTVTDGTLTRDYISNLLEVSGEPGDQFAVLVYRVVVDLTDFADGLIIANAKAYPHVGDAASINDSSVNSGGREFSPRYFLKDTTLFNNPPFAYVASTGVDASGVVSTTAATASATPFLTINGALTGLAASRGAAGLDGCIIRVKDSVGIGAAGVNKIQKIGAVYIERDPNVSKATANILWSTTLRPKLGVGTLTSPLTTGSLIFRDLTITRSGTAQLQGESASAFLEVSFNNVTFNNASVNAGLLSSAHLWWNGVECSNMTAKVTNATANFEHRMMRGIISSFSGAIYEGFLMLGCNLTNSASCTPNTRNPSGTIIQFNRFTNPSAIQSIATFAGTEDVSNCTVSQNIIETCNGTSGPQARVSSDSATGDSYHILLDNNTMLGGYTAGRVNVAYDEGATPRTNRLFRMKNSILSSWYTKGDVFVSDGSRVGNWAHLYGVGCKNMFTQWVNPTVNDIGDDEGPAFPGLGAKYATSNTVRYDPMFVDYQAITQIGTTQNNGAGGGDYSLLPSSPCINMVNTFDEIFSHDLYGNIRDKGSIGASAGNLLLASLSLSASSIQENSASGTVIGNIINKTVGSTLTLFNDAGSRFAINGSNQIIAGSVSTDYEVATSHSITIRETLGSMPNSPNDTVLTINVTDVSEDIVTLTALTLSSSDVLEGAASGTFIGNIIGFTLGSTLTLFNDAGSRFAINGSNQIIAGLVNTDYSVATSHSITIRETFAGATNTPRDTVLTINVDENISGVIGTLPTLPVTPDRIVTNRAELIQAIADAGTTLPIDAKIAVDATILDLGSTSITSGGFTNQTVTINKPITLYPLAGYGAYDVNPYGDGSTYAWRFERTCTIYGYFAITADAKIYGFRRTINVYPGASDQTTPVTWQDVGVSLQTSGISLDNINGSASPILKGNEYLIGKNIAHEPFDPTARPTPMKSPATWKFASHTIDGNTSAYGKIVEGSDPEGTGTLFTGHGDADWVSYNVYAAMPEAIGTSSWTGSSMDISCNYIHDIGAGVTAHARSSGTEQVVDIYHNEFARIYIDNIRTTRGLNGRGIFKTHNNIIGPVISNAYDSMNPHSDGQQGYGAEATSGVMKNWAHLRAWGNLMWSSSDGRGSYQGYFLQVAFSHYAGATDAAKGRYKAVGWEIHESALLNPNKIFACDGGQSHLISNVTGINQESARPNDLSGVPQASLYIQRGNSNIGFEEIPDTMNIIDNCTFEGYAGSGYSASKREVGQSVKFPVATTAGRSSSTSTSFINLNRSTPGPNEAFLALAERQPGVTSGISANTLAELLSTPQPDIVRVDYIQKVNADLNTLYESEYSYVHGIVGISRVVDSISAGLEWRVLDAWDESVVKTWSSVAGTIESGQLLQLRFTTPAGELTQLDKTLNVAGITVTISVITKSNAVWPLVDFTSTRLVKSTNGLTGGVNSSKLSIFFEFVASNNGVTQQLFIAGTGTSITGKINTSNSLDLLFRLGGSTILRVVSATTFVSGTRYKIHLSIDTTLPSVSEAVQLFINDAPANLSASTSYVKDSLLQTGLSEVWHLFSTSTNSFPFIGNLAAMVIWVDEAIDWSDAINRSRTTAGVFDNGSIITGSIPEIYIKGDATLINGTNIANLGSGGVFDNVGSDVVQL